MFRTRNIILSFFMAGFLCGILFANVFMDSYVMDTSLFRLYDLEHFLTQKISYGEFFLYILALRTAPVVILPAFQNTRIHKASICLFLLWTGFSSGLLMSVELVQMGGMGMLFFLAGIFPQVLCYLFSYYVICYMIYEKKPEGFHVKVTVMIAGGLLLGILCETYINPFVVKAVIRLLAG